MRMFRPDIYLPDMEKAVEEEFSWYARHLTWSFPVSFFQGNHDEAVGEMVRSQCLRVVPRNLSSTWSISRIGIEMRRITFTNRTFDRVQASHRAKAQAQEEGRVLQVRGGRRPVEEVGGQVVERVDVGNSNV